MTFILGTGMSVLTAYHLSIHCLGSNLEESSSQWGKKKDVIDDIQLIIKVFVFLSLPADGAEVLHTLPTRLNILCLASEN